MPAANVSANIFFFVNDSLVGGLVVYAHGEPTELGADLFDMLAYGEARLVNGGIEDPAIDCPAYFNGAQCLGAYVTGALKGRSIGGIYMTTEVPEADEDWKPWTYIFRQVLSPQDAFMGLAGELMFEVHQGPNMVYGGPLREYVFPAA